MKPHIALHRSSSTQIAFVLLGAPQTRVSYRDVLFIVLHSMHANWRFAAPARGGAARAAGAATRTQARGYATLCDANCAEATLYPASTCSDALVY